MKTGTSFFYCLGQGFKGIKRNRLFFVASVATIAACIFMIGLFFAVVYNLNHMLKEAEQSICVTIFFDEELSESEIQKIGGDIANWSEVSRVEYTSATEAWEKFKEEYFANNPELADGFADDNPLANSASYDIFLKDISTQRSVVARLETTEGIRQVNRSEITADVLSDVGRIVGIVSIVLIGVLLAVSIFLITNTIITGITVRKEEIKIMKYVGATDFFVKSPFVFEGIITGLIGAIIPLVVLFFIYRWAMNFMVTEFSMITGTLSVLPLWDVFSILIPGALLIGAGIGFIGSIIATGKHIKV
ncbi:MAG: permease-like cell division protein FtsX [Lachnospiraceae bacterium]|nr:permease-like cell division protein FtsX [Lachnospiraceae bacterium]